MESVKFTDFSFRKSTAAALRIITDSPSTLDEVFSCYGNFRWTVSGYRQPTTLDLEGTDVPS